MNMVCGVGPYGFDAFCGPPCWAGVEKVCENIVQNNGFQLYGESRSQGGSVLANMVKTIVQNKVSAICGLMKQYVGQFRSGGAKDFAKVVKTLCRTRVCPATSTDDNHSKRPIPC